MGKTRRQKRGVFAAIYRPIGKAIRAANSITGVATKSVKKVVSTGLRTANSFSKRAASNANSMIRGILPKKRRATRRRR